MFGFKFDWLVALVFCSDCHLGDNMWHLNTGHFVFGLLNDWLLMCLVFKCSAVWILAVWWTFGVYFRHGQLLFTITFYGGCLNFDFWVLDGQTGSELEVDLVRLLNGSTKDKLVSFSCYITVGIRIQDRWLVQWSNSQMVKCRWIDVLLTTLYWTKEYSLKNGVKVLNIIIIESKVK